MRILTAAATLVALVAATSPAAAEPPAETVQARCERLAGVETIKKPDRPAALAACTEAHAAQPGAPKLLHLKAMALFWSEKDVEAFALLDGLAERNYVPAIHDLAVMHHWGYGVPENPAKAMDLYRRALAAGEMRSAIALGYAYRNGSGVPKDPVRAAEFYRRAADAGVAAGEMGLGYAYEVGLGVPQDLARAAQLYRSAGAKNDPHALHNLGFMTAQGRGVPKDQAEAIRLYRLSAANGGTNGMFAMALAHQRGNGVAKDEAESERWLRMGIEAGDEVDAPNSLAYRYALQDRNLEEAEKLAEGAHKAAPENAAVMDTLALIRMKRKRYADAVLLMRKSIALEPTPIHLARLGDIYSAMGLKAEAREQWRRALRAKDEPDAEVEITPADLRRRIALAGG
jgi:TPR repeat protein